MIAGRAPCLPDAPAGNTPETPGHGSLNWFLCWAVVYAPVGTSLFYAPGVLFSDAGRLTGLSMVLSSVVFIFLVGKYVDVAARYPEGGGIVAVTTQAFGSWAGLAGGLLATVSYFLTAAVSAVTGFAFLNSVAPITSLIVLFSVLSVLLLGLLNYVGIKESAIVTAVFGGICFVVQLIIALVVATQVQPDGWRLILDNLTHPSGFAPGVLLLGFASAFLAFSGLESISQLSPAIALPRRRTARLAMTAVVITALCTIPLVTTFATNLITLRSQHADETVLTTIERLPERERLLAHTTDPAQRAQLDLQISDGRQYADSLVSQLGAQFGGAPLKLAVVLSATTLLVLACSTAIIGAYHVFMALARQRFLPALLTRRNDRFGTPHWAIALATLPPTAIIVASRGDMRLLGQLFAFGLLGSFCMTSIGLDVVRWNERRLNGSFLLGLLTTACVVVAWVANLYNKPYATIFGGALVALGLGVAVMVRRGRAGEVAVTGLAGSLDELPRGAVLVPVFDEGFSASEQSMFEFAGTYARSVGAAVIVLYIRDIFDVLQVVHEEIAQDPSAAAFVAQAEAALAGSGVPVSVLYESSSEPQRVVEAVQRQCRPRLTVTSPHARSSFMRLLHGDAMQDIGAGKGVNVLVYPAERSDEELRRIERPDGDHHSPPA